MSCGVCVGFNPFNVQDKATQEPSKQQANQRNKKMSKVITAVNEFLSSNGCKGTYTERRVLTDSNPHGLEPYLASCLHVWMKTSTGTSTVCGNGQTADQAVIDYARKVSGKTLVQVYSDGNTRELSKPVPNLRMMLCMEVCAKFLENIRAYLPELELREIDRLNKTEEYKSCCGSHNFCDTNIFLWDAFLEVLCEPDLSNEKDVALINVAHSRARRIGFYAA